MANLPLSNKSIHSIDEIFFLFSHAYNLPFNTTNLCHRWKKQLRFKSFNRKKSLITENVYNMHRNWRKEGGNCVMPQFDWLCDICGYVMSLTSGIYWVDQGFINNYKEPQLWLVLLRYGTDVAIAFPWVVTYGNRAGLVTPCGLGDTTPQSGP